MVLAIVFGFLILSCSLRDFGLTLVGFCYFTGVILYKNEVSTSNVKTKKTDIRVGVGLATGSSGWGFLISGPVGGIYPHTHPCPRHL